MPLFVNARELIRINLEQFRPDVKVRVASIAIGTLTAAQLSVINENRMAEDLPPIIAEVLFHGWHAYKSRILGDGYEIEDVIDQIESAMGVESEVLYEEYMTAMENQNLREDRYLRNAERGCQEAKTKRATRKRIALIKDQRLARVTVASGCTSRYRDYSSIPILCQEQFKKLLSYNSLNPFCLLPIDNLVTI